jgi:micrococcal nuclease|tara:strand:+ start:454 stop:780 length:327 start_codon:yes stop_codon:yes gene_type:complete
MYEYKATVTKVYDGDTITVDFDLGFGILIRKQKIRLLGINTPEVRGPEKPQGIISRDALRQRILGKVVTIKTSKDKKGKYGRWLGEVFVEEENINQWLITEGYAKEYK